MTNWRETPMKCKDYRPICFEIMQTDMEKYMVFLDEAIKALSCSSDNYIVRERLQRMKIELQHKINCHIERKEWL